MLWLFAHALAFRTLLGCVPASSGWPAEAARTRPEALLEAVCSGRIRRAAVDVYPNEPAPGDEEWVNPYHNEARVVCTPHIGAATQEAQAARIAVSLVVL